MRLSQEEVQHLVEGRKIVEETVLPNGTFRYVLEVKDSVDDILNAALGDAYGIHVQIDAESIAHWNTDDRVGFERRLPLSAGTADSLFLLVEKDFPCAHAPDKNKKERRKTVT